MYHVLVSKPFCIDYRHSAIPAIKAASGGTLVGQTFQQDGAAAHKLRIVMNYLRVSLCFNCISILNFGQNMFGPNTLLLGASKWGGLKWSPNSPDLSLLDFCVWGVLKV